MVGVATTFSPIWLSSPTIIKSTSWNSNPRICSPKAFPTNPLDKSHTLSLSSAFPPHFSLQKDFKWHAQNLSLKAAASSSSSSVGSAEFTEEPATNVKFQTSVSLPGCLSPLSLLGTGYREKVFAIIGVKVYAAGLYLNQSIIDILDAWKGQPASAIREASSLFDSIFQAPQEKSLHIVLVRDVDGKTFWDALDDALSPRIKPPTAVDESALSTIRSIFQGQSLKKGTSIFLTWLQPGKMNVCVSSDGLPSGIDATVESNNVTLALFDVFLGADPVSPSLKASVANRLATILK